MALGGDHVDSSPGPKPSRHANHDGKPWAWYPPADAGLTGHLAASDQRSGMPVHAPGKGFKTRAYEGASYAMQRLAESKRASQKVPFIFAEIVRRRLLETPLFLRRSGVVLLVVCAPWLPS